MTAGRGPLSDWSAQVQVCGGRNERQLLVTRVSCTCDGGRLCWATLAGIRGVRHRLSEQCPAVAHEGGMPVLLVFPDSGPLWFGFGAQKHVCRAGELEKGWLQPRASRQNLGRFVLSGPVPGATVVCWSRYCWRQWCGGGGEVRGVRRRWVASTKEQGEEQNRKDRGQVRLSRSG